jgi:N-acetylneuraminic acid mutarotase
VVDGVFPGAMSRRLFLGAAGAAVAAPALAQHAGHAGHVPLYERLNQPGRIELPDLALQQRVTDSPAPAAAVPGRWVERAPLPVPRTEMAWAAERGGRLHVVGGYAEQRVDRPYHHAYDPAADAWTELPELPRGANHVGVAELDGRIYAIGGFVEQNRRPHDECFVFGAEGERWSRIAPLPEACGAIGCVALDGRIHAVGGAVGDTFDTRVSIDGHLVYDPAADRWERAAPMPLGRDHVGIVALGGLIHLIGGRVGTFHPNSALHHTWDPREDRWRQRVPMPTPRSGHGAVVYRGKIHCMGGEGTNRVFGTHEAYDPTADAWASYAPMATPRHGMGAVVLGDAIHVAGGGPQVGGGVKSAVHEAFVLEG